MRGILRAASPLLLASVLAVACTAEDPVLSAPGNGNVDGGAGGVDGGGGGGDGGVAACTDADNSCNGNTLKACKTDGTGFVDKVCPLGCQPAPPAHCKVPVPANNGMTTADLVGTGLGEIAIVTANTVIDTDTGSITNIRTDNADPTVREVNGGVAFHVVDIPNRTGAKMGVFSFKGLTVSDSVTVTAFGVNALGIAAEGDIKIVGILDGRGSCATDRGGPGGGVGGSASGQAGGVGKGAVGISDQSTDNTGGGGGGFGDVGGTSPGFPSVTAGGVVYGSATLVPLFGGSGGGRGGKSGTPTGGDGGGGGGALHLVAGRSIIIGAGGAKGGINAGGCGGRGAVVPNVGAAGGGGGGSGGGILLEAPEVKLDAFGALVVNGGAGGGGAYSNGGGANGGFGRKAEMASTQVGSIYQGAGNPAGNCGSGGYGGASTDTGSTLKGGNGTGGGSGCGSGGGGGVGRIRVNTSTGAVTVVDSTGFVSSRFTDVSSTNVPASTQGTITVE